MKLSVLKNAAEGCLTYYTGSNFQDVSHLNDCTLLCNKDFFPPLKNVKIQNVEDPQLEFYKLSREYREDYLDVGNMKFIGGSWIHHKARVGNGTVIYPGCTIGESEIGENVTIYPNTVIFAKTKIGDSTVIDSNCSIGSSGMMWVWSKEGKVFLEQLGNVVIGKNCKIGSNTCIVRGSANESTFVDDESCLAPGCMIGHGAFIGKRAHLANNVSMGGSTCISAGVFLGSGSTISPGSRIKIENVIVGAGAVVTKDILESGIYAGVPAKKIKNVETKMRGVPKWLPDTE
jgi:UDP-3-O-[3-hydroxymyristoyl] glucosamine N-acyltransferase LpxD